MSETLNDETHGTGTGDAGTTGRHAAHAARTGSNYSSSTADEAVEALHRIDEKVNDMRERRLNDPDSLLDKLFKWAFPSVIGLVAGKAFQMLWDQGTSKRNLARGLAADAPQGFVSSLAFAAASAAFGAIVSQLSDRGSKAFVDHRHRSKARRAGNAGKQGK
ncbi:hypothetical protein BW13_09775 [Bifidobacterium sp. UTCIF-37]|uniref:DUF4235 domain-containing protein n=1 Tax=unclassified Bifidobacterium TaxID=2608897 RepID=UPI00112B30AD|nr:MULTISPECIES: DUF4235 domain-containing protein [unclassified Bifidobacterium]TPF85583.1 hypothetical protein BW13_09775 [Bifidobacterium sp. UTCIF-37]TPF87686.1 hypothetical protein BW11_10050 [Bifidobacterium sp. UTCIF-38]